MYKSNHFFPLLVIGLLILLLICPGPASALNVVGSKYMETVRAGDTVTHIITVSTKTTDPPMDIVIDVLGFGQTGEKSYSALSASEDASPYSARKYITLDTRSFHLNPGESRKITATIAVPDDVGDGGRYAIISLHNAPSVDGTTAYVTAISIPVMITIAGSLTRQAGEITDIKANDYHAGQPLHLITSFKNTGNIHYYRTKNTVSVTDSGGNVIGTAGTNPSIFAIIPSYMVTYDSVLGTAPVPGTYEVKSEVSLEDGTILDTKTSAIELTTVTQAAPTQDPENLGQTKSPVPVTTVLLALGLVLTIFASWSRRNQ